MATAGANFLPAASYNLVKQVDGRGVYSFCMCPGGFIVPSATSQEEVVVNGMSPSERNSPYANSGIVVEIRPEDLLKYSNSGKWQGLSFRKSWNAKPGKTEDIPRGLLHSVLPILLQEQHQVHCQKFPIFRVLPLLLFTAGCQINWQTTEGWIPAVWPGVEWLSHKRCCCSGS